jgi:hypothetical protein
MRYRQTLFLSLTQLIYFNIINESINVLALQLRLVLE